MKLCDPGRSRAPARRLTLENIPFSWARNLGPGAAWSIGEIVKARVAVVGLDGDFGAHSLRAGFATAAARGGFGEAAIMKHGRWKSVAVARRYIRAGNRWDESVPVL